MTIYRLTPRAVEDLRQVARYTKKQWGHQQRDIYIKRILQRCSWLAAHPRLGRRRPDLHPDYYCFPEGQHLIFYRIDDKAIAIIGILHQSMDVDSALKTP
ncbi:plasmid stabilization protein [Xaviernesmea oryzae]|uniref:Toxin n=1 Tax=Xaviernesmea oryzae TaxID=464029 RepID=A0A1Q9B0I9_9HYPH|nr:type II toxin-antitoxin system RelE/ParE family toxin [Xaviernesmea oryzae]OLP61498.1 plasmid stabilization protein [Xaviernesmea oryzae]SEL67373.1 toxin ParE1/3/4 [Xaviernesmea oryzae]